MRIRREAFVYEIDVKLTTGRRVSAQLVSTLFEETPESIEIRQQLLNKIRAERQGFKPDPGRPNKRNRRLLGRLKRPD